MRADNDYFNQCNPRSFINLVPPKLKSLILQIPDDLWELNERELIERVYGRQVKSVPELDAKVRLSLWKHYDLKCRAEYVTQIKAEDIVAGLMDQRRFFRECLNFGKLRLYVSEPQDDWVKYEDLLQLSLPEMREIMAMPVAINIKTGLPGYDLLKLKFEIFRYLDERQRGAITRKIQTESLNVNVDAKASDLKRFKSIEDINAEIKRLEGDAPRELVAAKPLLEPLLEMVPIEAERVLAKEELMSKGEG